MNSPKELLSVCLDAVKAGGEALQTWQGRVIAKEKGPQDFVTQADLASQTAIQGIISRHFPEHDFVGEETEAKTPLVMGGWQWFVDPLDGTTNFVHGLPYFAVSVAVAHNGSVLAGAVLDPSRNECFAAAKGAGATLGGRAIRVSSAASLHEALLAFSLPARVRAGDPELADFTRLAYKARGLRRLGAAALNLCYVAAGRLDGYWARRLHAWDLAAGSLIVSEAGGEIASHGASSVQLTNPGICAAATGSLFAELHAELL
jgi:myo-inositol-1(or 4)-monophosphatase